MSYPSSSTSIAMRKPKGLSKGAACVTCKLRKVRCDAVKPACTACRRSARWRGDDAVGCCYVEATPRRKSSKSHHDDLLRHCLRSASGDSTASSSGVSTPSSERSEHPFSNPPSPALLDLESLLAFPIPSFPAITSSTFALPELPPLDGTFASSLDASTKGKASSMDALAYPTDMDLDSLLLDLALSLPLPTWPPALDSSTVVSDPSFPTIGGVACTAPQYASDLVASPSSYLDLDFDLGPCPPLSPSFTASFDSFVAPPPPLELSLPQGPGLALAETNPPAPSSTRSLPLARRAARPERIAIPNSDPADPFAAAFGQALAERLCSGAAQLEL
ncbi:uncharacterized protein RHOBADRAFT_53876 [Rhodotorula graminis WP1]|uniref:Zn(2)-C6 fungal-type domain-containing protein n=1 Tax=Rhodotorula graminis (strain WP1) TaxID=578459 RepID=A0A194S2J9_RHOGW|nr:uncharacterized protein RHOBADRAFT_53876 [Rhodotorula graminis WP1]KPV74958.1 hypothetical protein RHOBADRAFT_53876 [Rhodotorula graminis WP1]